MGKDVNDAWREGRDPLEIEGEPVQRPPTNRVSTHENATTLLTGTHVSEIAAELLSRLSSGPSLEAERIPWPGGKVTLPSFAGPRPSPGDILPSPDLAQWGWDRTWSTLGPWFPDRLAVLVGGTGRGKSAMAIQVAEAAARAGAPVLYVSAEMSAEEVLARLLALRSSKGVSYIGILQGVVDPEEVGRALESLIKDCPHLYLWAPNREHRTGEALQSAALHIVRLTGGRPPLILVDYLQRLTGDSSADRRIQVGDLSGSLRDMARRHGLGKTWPGAAILVLSSVARTHYNSFSSVTDLRAAAAGSLEGCGKESGEIEYDAPLVLAMTSDPDPFQEGYAGAPAERRALLAVAKNRHGAARGLIPFRFYARCGRFLEVGEKEDIKWWPSETDAKNTPSKTPNKNAPRMGGLSSDL